MSDDFFPRDNRQPRHFWADNEIFDIYGPKLGAHGFAVYMALAKHAMNNSGECRTSISKIAAQLDMSKGGVFNALAKILQLGLAQKSDEGDNRHCAAYVLADVKALTDPNYAQLRLAGSVHTVNAEHNLRSSGEPSVHPVNSRVHPMNAAFTPRTRNKESKTSLQDLQDFPTKRKAFDLPAADRPAGEISPISSSRKSDDDTGENPTALAKVLQAFEDSPVTTGKANASDRRTAAEFLRLYPVEKIEYGILLATARRMGTPQFEESTAKVRSLAYFADAIEEACSDEHINSSYAQYLKHAIQRREGVAPLPKKAGVHA